MRLYYMVRKSSMTYVCVTHLDPGPASSPYEGGVFVVDIILTDQYPFEPPKMKVWRIHCTRKHASVYQ